MCGIVGVVTSDKLKIENIKTIALDVLSRLEYRGYDSAGFAMIDKVGDLKVQKALGNIAKLKEESEFLPSAGNAVICHTRWATHGKPSVINSHPHASEAVAVVHNGIIENYQQLKAMLIEKEGYSFISETDTEVITALIDVKFRSLGDVREAFKSVLPYLKGTFALAVLFKGVNMIAVAKRLSPLLIGLSGNKKDTFVVCSDMAAISDVADKYFDLPDDHYGFITSSDAEIYSFNGSLIDIKWKKIDVSVKDLDKGDYKYFIEKEIHQQSEIVQNIMRHYFDSTSKLPVFNIDIDFSTIDNIKMIACGSSYNAAVVMAYQFENFAKINADAYIASEFRQRKINFASTNTLYILISQSGETVDTLSIVELLKQKGQLFISLVNNAYSLMSRLSPFVLQCHAGVEVSVASTKAFVAQLYVLSLLALHIGIIKGSNFGDNNVIFENILKAPSLIAETVDISVKKVPGVASKLVSKRILMFTGRNTAYGIAMEGALKMKELSYLAVDATAAGELKHGHFALIDKDTAIIVVVPENEVIIEKTVSNINEILARGENVFVICSEVALNKVKECKINEDCIMVIPSSNDLLNPILSIIPLQVLAYQVAVLLGREVDRPRNLAKSVTVE